MAKLGREPERFSELAEVYRTAMSMFNDNEEMSWKEAGEEIKEYYFLKALLWESHLAYEKEQE